MLGTLVVHCQCAEHTHPLHQGGRCQNFAFRQATVILFHLAVMPHARVQLGIAGQQFGNLGVVAAFGVAVQCAGVVLFQFIIQRGSAENSAALFLTEFLCHLPLQKCAELRPKIKSLPILAAQHGGVLQQPVQHFPGVGVAADHPHHFHIKVLKQRKLQQKPPHSKVKAVVYRLLKVGKHFPVGSRYQLRAERLAAGHLPRRDHHAQGAAEAFLYNNRDLALGYGDLVVGKIAADILPVKKQVVRLQGGHQPRVPERRHTGGRNPAGKQHKPAGRVCADQIAKRLQLLLLLYELEVVDQQNIPFVRQPLQRKIRCIGTQAKRAPFAQQGVCHRCFAKAAGRTEKKDAPIAHNTVKFLPDSRFYQDISVHVCFPISVKGRKSMVVRYLNYTIAGKKVNHPEV